MFTPQECVRIVKAIQDRHPDVLEEAKEIIKLPEATIHYFFVLPRILRLFCEFKKIADASFIGNHISRAGVGTRTTFIAIIYKLYNPEIYTPYYDKSKDNLRNELSGMLQCNPATISQALDSIPVQLKAYEEFRNEVETFVDYVRGKMVEKENDIEQVELFELSKAI
jgi:hypothetical protein